VCVRACVCVCVCVSFCVDRCRERQMTGKTDRHRVRQTDLCFNPHFILFYLQYITYPMPLIL
jgi:hypothetical protein